MRKRRVVLAQLKEGLLTDQAKPNLVFSSHLFFERRNGLVPAFMKKVCASVLSEFSIDPEGTAPARTLLLPADEKG
jgi:hypothetical protein